MRIRTLLSIVLLLSSAACYHAIIETGAAAGNEMISRPWSSGWIYGLVPPSPISAASQCRSGVARVETQLSFVNQLVSLLTLGIYTPMDIRVTCAASRAEAPSSGVRQFALNAEAPTAVYQSVFMTAASAAVASGEPAFVVFGGQDPNRCSVNHCL
jgi:hypothetical protein